MSKSTQFAPHLCFVSSKVGISDRNEWMCCFHHYRSSNRCQLCIKYEQSSSCCRSRDALWLHRVVSFIHQKTPSNPSRDVTNDTPSYAGFVDTTVYVYCSEIFPNHIRAKGMGWSIGIFFLSTLPFLESSATGFATIGWKYYLLFIILPSINVVLIYFFCPEVSLANSALLVICYYRRACFFLAQSGTLTDILMI